MSESSLADVVHEAVERTIADLKARQPVTLTEFLLARIAEDEEVARSVRPDEYLSTRDSAALAATNRDGYATVGVTSGRVLAECEAKRRIVSLFRHFADPGYAGEDALKAIAIPYADHPDFDPAWS